MSALRGRTALGSMENTPVTVSNGVPAFLAKLWKLVEDPQSNQLISWSPVSRQVLIFVRPFSQLLSPSNHGADLVGLERSRFKAILIVLLAG